MASVPRAGRQSPPGRGAYVSTSRGHGRFHSERGGGRERFRFPGPAAPPAPPVRAGYVAPR
eukprot:1167017-Lingulodinium_polyedra.AAC.1